MSARPPNPGPDDPVAPLDPAAASPADADAGTAVLTPEAGKTIPAPPEPVAASDTPLPDVLPKIEIVAPPVPPGVIRIPPKIIAEPERRTVDVTVHETPEEALRSAKEDGRTRQSPLLLVVPILAGHEDALRKVLAEVAANDVENNYLIPFARLRTVHFARFVLHDKSPSENAPIPTFRGVAQAHGPAIPAKLLFSTDYDGPLQAHLDELVDKVGDGLSAVFQYCEGYPPEGQRTPAAVHAWMARYFKKTDTFYTGTMNRSVLQIRREAKLRDAIEEFIDREKLDTRKPEDALEVRAKIQRFVESRPDLAWARVAAGPYPKTAWFAPLVSLKGVALIAAVFVAAVFGIGKLLGWSTMTAVLVPLGILVAVAAALGAAWFYLLRLEKRDPVIIDEKWQERTKELILTEDRIVQNEMSSVIYIKEPLWFRQKVLGAVLGFINFAARNLSNQGNLAGIPSIHFARWVVVDDGRRLVFFSNFDGSWQNYLGDFIDKSANGLTAVWSNCVGFPRTRGLVGMGARNEQKFKQYSRQSQIPTQVWYSAYKWLSVDNINNNTRIRLDLFGELSADEAKAWLRRF